jgi:hypothetical protein
MLVLTGTGVLLPGYAAVKRAIIGDSNCLDFTH